MLGTFFIIATLVLIILMFWPVVKKEKKCDCVYSDAHQCSAVPCNKFVCIEHDGKHCDCSCHDEYNGCCI